MVLVGRLPGRLVFRFLFTRLSLLNIVFKTTVINYFKMFEIVRNSAWFMYFGACPVALVILVEA